jgi:xanthine dehydrogenase YagT iron-sulfur-binding subunit
MQSKTKPEVTPSFGHLSRRTFLSRLGATGAVAAAASPLLGLAQAQLKQEQAETPVTVSGGVPLTLRVNGREHQVQIDPRTNFVRLSA